jgi:hypothetical protein
VTFLDEIAHRQAEIAELGGHGNHQPHMGHGDLVAGVLILVVLPGQRQRVLFIPCEIGSRHGDLDHAPVC